jgi:hypothetical protein
MRPYREDEFQHEWEWPRKDGIPQCPYRQKWNELLKIAPQIDSLGQTDIRREKTIPKPMADYLFLSLVACFADSKKRHIIRAILLDALGDDLVELIKIATTDSGEQQ